MKPRRVYQPRRSPRSHDTYNKHEIQLSLDSARREVYAIRPKEVVDYTYYATDAASGVTDLDAATDAGASQSSYAASERMVAESMSVTWLSDNAPSGDWVVGFLRRTAGGSWEPVSSFVVSTS